MKLRLLSALLVLLCVAAQAELVNMNPDPDGDPWYVGGLRSLTAADSVWLDSLPRLTTPANYRTTLRNEVDNTTQPWFRPIFNQEGGSCGQASGVGYNYTYEINWLRGLAADSDTTQYPTHYTWNFLNDGVGGGSWYWDGWNIIRAGGVCNVAEYGGHFAYGGEARWMSGYDAYYAGMDNRMGDVMAIEVDTPEGLETLKGWMTDYLTGEETGGLANFGCGMSPYYAEELPVDSQHAGESMVLNWDSSPNHAMTFAAYNDSIRYDFNNDGEYTNDVDTNLDGVVDMRDWEIGALKVVNSWGEDWENDGCVWMAYRLLATPLEDGGISGNIVHVMHARDGYEPLLTASATISHNRRYLIKVVAGVSTDTTAVEPQHTLEFPYFHFQGGAYPMQGWYDPGDSTLVMGLDLTPLLGYIEPGQPARFFLEVHENDAYGMGRGQLNDWSVFDHTGDETVEWATLQGDTDLVNDGVTRMWADAVINYQSVTITTDWLPTGTVDEFYEETLAAQYGEPPYAWRLIRNYAEDAIDWQAPAPFGGELTMSHNDDGYAVLPLPFSFPFYTESYDSVLVCSDGSIVFDRSVVTVRSLQSLMQTRAITPYGSDLQLYTDDGDGVWYWIDDGYVSVCWIASRFDDQSFDAVFEVKLYPSGRIDFIYGDEIAQSANWVAGVSEGDNGNFTVMSLSGDVSLPASTAVSFNMPSHPAGMNLSEDGVFSGTPAQQSGQWLLLFRVTDSNGVSDEETIVFHTHPHAVGDAPLVVALLRAWPNPFNPTTSLRFSLPQPADVRLDVYNVRGQRVTTLLDDTLEAGEHTVLWRGQNDDGAPVSSGVYFARLQAGKHEQTAKLLLLK